MKLPEFREADHTYWLDGKRLPSVTEILREAGLIETFGYTVESRDRGRAVHLAIDLLEQGALDYDSLDYRVAPFIRAYSAFLSVATPTVIHCERLVYSPSRGYAGTLDQYLYISGRPALVDIKTGSVPSWVGAQLAGYHVAGVECRVIAPRARRFALELRADETFRLIEQTGNDWPTFESALNLWKEKHGNSN